MTSPPVARPTVVALGGNAISPAGERDSIENQFEQTRRTAVALADLVCSGPCILVHGNGPQVGAAVLRNELASRDVYEVPLDILVADLQGGMGFMISQCLTNELHRRAIDRAVTTVITTVEVDADDPAFGDPSKPIGPFFEMRRAPHLEALGWNLVRVPDRGVRRIVPSPRPRAIVEIGVLRRLLAAGETVIAVGGGGVPVVRDKEGNWSGREAVIDKDLAAGLLARDIDASQLVNITGVDRVSLDFRTPDERPLDHLTAADARRHLEAGQFPRGSMGPKIEAAVEFLEASASPDARVIITDIEHAAAAIDGKAGTVITR